MPANVWICSVCKTVYPDKESASRCEKVHRDFHSFEITGAYYPSLGDLRVSDRELSRRVPSSIKVKFSDEHGDFASYRLEHFGYKGM